MPLKHDIRFCTTSDGVRIAYETHGSGYPMVWVTGWIGHLELDEFTTAKHIEYWSRLLTVVRYDKRNTGLSDRGVTEMSVEARVRDLEAVVDALGLERFAINGMSEGGPIAISYAAKYPERVSHLLLYGTYAHGAFASEENIAPLASMVRSQWGLASSIFTDLLLPDATPEDRRHSARLQREGASADDAVRLLMAIKDVDVRPLLPSVTAKTLVIHGKHDRAVPFSQARELAAGIRGAALVSLDAGHGTTGTGPEIDERMYRASHELLADVLAGADNAEGERAGGLCTVLFTDIVGHTEMMQRLGDERGRNVLREHERITRDLLKHHGGAEVKTMGDGFMASFGSVTKAMDCAIALQRAFEAHTEATNEPLQVRVGLNAGEPIEEDGDLFGATVILASRIAAKAGAGEILIPEPLRHLLSGKTYAYADRGETMLKGFEDAVRLYEVRWRG
jgi:class 3 adenylate cyclase